ncbi:MAG: AAA family ATPase, partial [Dehalococcoidia bacterium]
MICASCGHENTGDARFCGQCGTPLGGAVLGTPLDHPFVGRTQELAQLEIALDRAASGQGTLATVVGEPGIGKTRLCQELADVAAGRGIWVPCGYCYEGEGAPAYWPWIQVLRGYIDGHDAETLTRVMGPGAAEIAELVPELAAALGELAPSPPLENPAQARFRLFDAITTFLKRASKETPLLLILEDLHWADRSSLSLLEFVAKDVASMGVLLLATYRDVEVTRRHPLSQTLGSLVRDQHFRRVQLGGMSQAEVGQFVQSSAGIVPQPRLVEAIHTRTDGNPLFVGQVVGLLSQSELSGDPDINTRIPEGVRDAIGRRLERLSDDCNRVLTIASVIGREFRLQVLRPLAGDLAEAPLMEAIDEAIEARVVDDPVAPGGNYHFSHALVQETLLEELSVTHRIRLHAEIAEVLEDVYGAQVEAHASELLHHLSEAEAVLGAEKLVHYARLAGEQSMASYAYEEAAAHFQRGLTSKEGQPADAERAALLVGLGKALAADPRSVDDAHRSLTEAFDYYDANGDVAAAVEVAAYPVMDGNVGFDDLVRRAAELVPADSHDGGRLLSQVGWNLGMQRGDYEGARDAFDRALAIARREGDVSLEMWTLTRLGHVEVYYNHPDGCLSNHDHVFELNSGIADPEVDIFSRACVVGVLMSTGDPGAAASHCDAMLAMAERARHRRGEALALMLNATLGLFRGEWAASRGYMERGLALGQEGILRRRMLLEYTLGNVDEGERYLERVLERMRRNPSGPLTGHIAVALVSAITGNKQHL